MRRKMMMIISVFNFEPNEKARKILSGTYVEDITTLLLLISKNQKEYTKHHDYRGTLDKKVENLFLRTSFYQTTFQSQYF